MRICLSSTHFIPNTYNVVRFRYRIFMIIRILSVENDATKGTRQTAKGKCILMLSHKAPYLGFLPVPAFTQGFQGEYGALLAILNRGSSKRKSVAEITVYRMTPQIQPRIRLFKRIIQLCQSFGNIAGNAQKTIAFGNVNRV